MRYMTKAYHDADVAGVIKGLLQKGVALVKTSPDSARRVFEKVRAFLVRLKEKVKDHPYIFAAITSAIALTATLIRIAARSKAIHEFGDVWYKLDPSEIGAEGEVGYLSRKYPKLRDILRRRNAKRRVEFANGRFRYKEEPFINTTLTEEDKRFLDEIRQKEFAELKKTAQKIVDLVNKAFYRSMARENAETVTLDSLFGQARRTKRRSDAVVASVLKEEKKDIQLARDEVSEIRDDAISGRPPRKEKIRGLVSKLRQQFSTYAKVNRERLYKENILRVFIAFGSASMAVASLVALRKFIKNDRTSREMESMFKTLQARDQTGTLSQALGEYMKRPVVTREDRDKILSRIAELLKSRMKDLDTAFMYVYRDMQSAEEKVSEAYREHSSDTFRGVTIDV